ncbi:hypothetical protein VNO78_27650 [Psophocarpus tetragonolobus]|uniref:Uncharacterized protein n=1 Tax=Psophocarpus tetragonolobus TaxID=3891 RepID=A0AAN9S1S0_PSOTE
MQKLTIRPFTPGPKDAFKYKTKGNNWDEIHELRVKYVFARDGVEENVIYKSCLYDEPPCATPQGKNMALFMKKMKRIWSQKEACDKIEEESIGDLMVAPCLKTIATKIEAGSLAVATTKRRCMETGEKPGEGKMTLLWDVVYAHNVLIRNHLLMQEDKEQIRKLSLLNICKGVQVLSNRLAVMSLISEEKVRD